MKHLMCDLETLGTVSGCSILSIGAVFFDPAEGLGSEFYQVISRADCLKNGLVEDPNTIKWWMKQSEQARSVMTEAEEETAMPLLESLGLFNAFIRQHTSVKLYGNGADFDNAILIKAYQAVGLGQGWGLYSGRCYRTIKNLFPETKSTGRQGTYHNALDDAKTQALHLIDIANNHSLALG